MIAKRLFDVFASLAGLTVLSPLFVVVCLFILIDGGRPIFFRQERVGLGGRSFKIMKFRTMLSNDTAGPEVTADGDTRITRVGHWLRKTKLDELPQLINVALGEMSLVGPRPEVPAYVAHYPEGAAERIFQVRPGITDKASIEFRNESAILASSQGDVAEVYIREILPIKVRYYLDYAANRSFFGDLKIILQTFIALLK